MQFRKIRKIFVPAFLLILLFMASILYLETLIQDPSTQGVILQKLSNAIGYDISTGKVEIVFREGIAISAPDFLAESRTGSEKISASRIMLKLDLGELLHARFVPKKVSLSRPRIEIASDRFFGHPLAPAGGNFQEQLYDRFAAFPTVSIESGSIIVPGRSITIENLYLDTFQGKGEKSPFRFGMRGILRYMGRDASFDANGKVFKGGIQAGKSLECSLSIKKIPILWFQLPAEIPAQGGRAETVLEIKGDTKRGLSGEGGITIENFNFLLMEKGQLKVFLFPEFKVRFKSAYKDGKLNIPLLEVEGNDFRLDANADIGLDNLKDPLIDLSLKAPFMPVAAFKRIFPTPLVGGWIERGLFPTIKEGMVEVPHFSLKGAVSEIMHLGKKENSGVLRMELVWKELEVIEARETIPYRDISGALIVEDGRLLVSDVVGKFGSSSISDSLFEIDSLYEKETSHRYRFEGAVELPELREKLERDFIPTVLRTFIEEIDPAQGILKGWVEIESGNSGRSLSLSQGEMRFSDCSFLLPEVGLPLKVDNAGIKIDKDVGLLFSGKGQWGSSSFMAKGSSDSALRDWEVDFEGGAYVCELYETFLLDKKLPLDFTGPVKCSGSVKKNAELWQITGEIDISSASFDSKYLSFRPAKGSKNSLFSIERHPEKGLILKEFDCNVGSSSFRLSGYRGPYKGDSIFLSLKTEDLSLEDLGIRFKDDLTAVKGKIGGRANAVIPFETPSNASINGKIEGAGIYFLSPMLKFPISDTDISLVFSDKKVLVSNCTGKFKGITFVSSGSLVGWGGLRGDLDVRLSYLDFEWLIRSGEIKEEEKRGGGIKRVPGNLELKVKIGAEKGAYKKIRGGPFSADCSIKSGNFYIERARSRLEHGELSLRGHIKPGEPSEKLFAGYISLHGQPVQEFLESLNIKDTYVEGVVDMDGVFYMKGNDKDDLIKSLTGSADVSVEKGVIKKDHIMFKVLDFLSLQKVFKDRPEGISKEGIYFDSIGGRLLADKGLVESEKIVMKSPVFNAAAGGKIDLSENRIDVDLHIQPLGSVDILVSKIPLVGYILAGEDKTFIVYYFTVEGLLSDPEIKYVPLSETIGATTKGYFERLFETPKRLFEGFSKMTQELIKRGVPITEEDLP